MLARLGQSAARALRMRRCAPFASCRADVLQPVSRPSGQLRARLLSSQAPLDGQHQQPQQRGRRRRRKSGARSAASSKASAPKLRQETSADDAATPAPAAAAVQQNRVNTPWKKSTGFVWLDRLVGLNNPETVRIRKTTAMFLQCLRPAEDPAFFEVFGIPCDGSRQWLAYHNVVGLHVWLLYRRIKADAPVAADGPEALSAEEARLLGQELYDRFWEDAIERVRETKVFEMMVNKHLLKAQEVTLANNVELDAGIIVDNDRDTEFGAALWRTIFRSDETVPERQIEALAKYVRAQHAKLQNLPVSAVVGVAFDWDRPEVYR